MNAKDDQTRNHVALLALDAQGAVTLMAAQTPPVPWSRWTARADPLLRNVLLVGSSLAPVGSGSRLRQVRLVAVLRLSSHRQ